MAAATEPTPSSPASPVPFSQFGPVSPIISPTSPLPDTTTQLHPGASPLAIPTASYSANQQQQNVRYSTPYVFSDEQTRTLSVGQGPVAPIPTGPPGSPQPHMSQIQNQNQPLVPIQPQPTAQMAYTNQSYPTQQLQSQPMSPNQTAPGQLSPELEAHRAAQLKAENSARRKEQAKECGAATCVGLGVTCLAISAATVMAMECCICFLDACTYY